MVAPIETIKKTFPRSAEALKKYYAFVDTLPLSTEDRKGLKAQAVNLVLVVGEEAAGIKRHIDLIRGLFGK